MLSNSNILVSNLNYIEVSDLLSDSKWQLILRYVYYVCLLYLGIDISFKKGQNVCQAASLLSCQVSKALVI